MTHTLFQPGDLVKIEGVFNLHSQAITATSNVSDVHVYGGFDLQDAVRRALAVYRRAGLWRKLQLVGMNQDWSWRRSAREYERLYRMPAER